MNFTTQSYILAKKIMLRVVTDYVICCIIYLLCMTI
jgi:hypothetical protein